MKIILLIMGALVSCQSVFAQESISEEKLDSREYKCVSSNANEVSELTLTGNSTEENWQLVGRVKFGALSPSFPLNFSLLSENGSQDGLVGSQKMTRLGRYRFYAEASTEGGTLPKGLMEVQVSWGYDCNCSMITSKMICIASD